MRMLCLTENDVTVDADDIGSCLEKLFPQLRGQEYEYKYNVDPGHILTSLSRTSVNVAAYLREKVAKS